MTLRFRSPQDTLQLLSKFMHQAGITRVADLSYLDNSSSIKIYSVVRPNSKSISISMGKSLDKKEAKCAALMESIETYFAEQVLPNFINISQKELMDHGILFVDMNKQGYNTDVSQNQKLDWCLGRTLHTNQEIYIPHVSLSLDSSILISAVIGQNSDGIASGSNFKEALIYSFLELIERSSTRFGEGEQLEEIDREKYKELNLRNLEYKFTYYKNIFDIPVIGCTILNSNPLDNQLITAGYACHFSKYHALTKALFEAVQSKVGVISGARDDLDEYCYVYNHINELLDIPNKLNFDDVSSLELSLNEQYQYIIELLRQNGKDLAVFTYLEDDITILKTFLIDNE